MSANVHDVSLTLKGALAVPASELAPSWEPTPLDLARYWTKVGKRGPAGCWVWIGGTHGRDVSLVGSIRWGAQNKPTNPTRIAWMLEHGPMREGVPVFRLCDTVLCVNPDHLSRDQVQGHNWRVAELPREKNGPHAKCTACKENLVVKKFYRRKTGGLLQPCRSCWQKQFTKSSESNPDPEIVRAAAIAHRGECVCRCLFTAHVEKKNARGAGDRGHCVNCGSEKCPGYFERAL